MVASSNRHVSPGGYCTRSGQRVKARNEIAGPFRLARKASISDMRAHGLDGDAAIDAVAITSALDNAPGDARMDRPNDIGANPLPVLTPGRTERWQADSS